MRLDHILCSIPLVGIAAPQGLESWVTLFLYPVLAMDWRAAHQAQLGQATLTAQLNAMSQKLEADHKRSEAKIAHIEKEILRLQETVRTWLARGG